MQLNQQKLVRLLPYCGLMPVPQPPPAGHARAEAGLLRQELPSDAGAEHEQDARQDLPVIQAPAARMTGTARHDRQQRLDPRPQLIRHDPRWLLALPRATINLKAITPVPRLFSGLS
jgi:hypothetical protein